jgi:uncharacterized protein
MAAADGLQEFAPDDWNLDRQGRKRSAILRFHHRRSHTFWGWRSRRWKGAFQAFLRKCRLLTSLQGAGACYTSRSSMAISKELLEILVCPVCKATVELKPDESGLKCVECHRVYPVRDDIPVMLIDQATIEE